MTDSAKRRGRPPKANAAPDPVVFSDARNAASVMAPPRTDAQDEIAEQARTQPGDAAHITTEQAEAQIEEAQHAAPPLHQADHSRRRSKQAIGENELAGLQLEAWDVAHSQEESIRFDTLGRRWRFYPNQTLTNHAEIVFEVRKGEDVREHHHSRAAYGTETAREQSDQIVSDLAAAL